MSIRKSLFISNIAMIFMPIIISVFYFLLLNVMFNGELKLMNHHWWQSQPVGHEDVLFTQLKEISSLDSKELLDSSYIDDLAKNKMDKNEGIIIRKNERTIYISKNINRLKNKRLPSFGEEGYNPSVWIGVHPYAVRQHDFYFNDGSKGTIILLNQGGQSIQFARRFFPMIFIGILFILVLTNTALSYYMSRRILRPIHQLSVAAAKISKGDFGFKMEAIRKDELGKLVETFDHMRLSLKEASELRDQYENNRKELIANISHDLKTPITAIRGYVEGIQDGVANTQEKLHRYLSTIHSKTEHMDHLIEELFLYSKLDVKSIPFQFKKLELKEFLEDYLAEQRLEENVQISMKTEKGFRSYASIDPDKMIRVMNNIIYNSMKYTDKDLCQIEIFLRDIGEKIMVSIQDNGPGVPNEELQAIFHRFYRGDPSRNSNTGGSGLGLAIAGQIMKAHGGEIWAESPPGKGLIIYFTLLKSADKGES